MQNIHISELRIDGFRGLKDFKMSLSGTTVLTGVNDDGKTTVLKALQLLFGDSSFLSPDDLHLAKNKRATRVIVDAKIIAVDVNGERITDFPDEWGHVLELKNLRKEEDEEGEEYFPLRVIYTYQPKMNAFLKHTQVLKHWEEADSEWQDIEGEKYMLNDECFQFHYIDTKRDIYQDLHDRTSYLFQIIGSVENDYSPEVRYDLDKKIRSLSGEVIQKNKTFKELQDALNGLASTMNYSGEVSVVPFARSIRDLNRSLTVLFGKDGESFPMDFHGMGLRSWCSLLSFKAFVNQRNERKGAKEAFFPILAIEEPEAHLHPNAQKQLYKQMVEAPGFKIISTHSPYVAATADLSSLRGMYKTSNYTFCDRLPVEKLSQEEQRKIKQAVLNSNGELLFAKAIVLSEGETEAQAMPIFFEKYFGKSPFEAGIAFVDVKGGGNYYPYVVMASSLHIPHYIFSDGEISIIKGLKNLVKTVYGEEKNLNDQKNIFVISDENNFEGMLLNDGYQEEIESAIELLLGKGHIDKFIQKNNNQTKRRVKTTETCEKCGQFIFQDIKREYNVEGGRLAALYDIMVDNKARLAPVLANIIIESSKSLPPLVVELFDTMKRDIEHV